MLTNNAIFPPFSQIIKVLKKIQQDQATIMCVLPRWPTQVRWPVARKLLVKEITVPPTK